MEMKILIFLVIILSFNCEFSTEYPARYNPYRRRQSWAAAAVYLNYRMNNARRHDAMQREHYEAMPRHDRYDPAVCEFSNYTPMSAPQPAAYLTYLNFAEHLGFLIAGSFAVFCNFRLLYYALFKRKSQAISMSRSIYVLICSHTVLLFVSLPYTVLMAWKKPDDLNEYSAYAMYWTGLPANCFMAASSIPVFFLTLDRCLSVKLSAHYNESKRKRLFVASIVAVCVASTVATVTTLVELPLDLNQSEVSVGCNEICGEKWAKLAQTRGCASSVCLLIKFKAMPILGIKMVYTTLNLILSCYFFNLLRKQRNFKKNDRVIRATVISDICLNIIPTYFFVAYNVGSGGMAANVFGQYLGMFAAFDAAFCSFIFSLSFLRKSSNNGNVIHVQSTSNNSRSKSEPAINSSVSESKGYWNVENEILGNASI
ncbi:hypothetical protein DdX_11890 [Ditylenchus destructor]|uniref:Uncharacterized protein n=1 Tax=Ditylenchus destructor TaxID=166010 RepID=A0AAD4MYR9_9BILA|nr:hypothetical protein DdX_11890 [Ditylenchus destructor]